MFSVCSVLRLLTAKDDSQEGQFDEYPQISSELVDIIPCSSTEQEKQVRCLLQNFDDVLQSKPGITNVLEHDIRRVNEKLFQINKTDKYHTKWKKASTCL